MANYKETLELINKFLKDTNKIKPFSDTLFQGIFIKKLSNSNLMSSKKYTVISTGKKTHQSHIDLTGQDTLNFFFGKNPASEAEYTQIMIDIPVDNLSLVEKIDLPTSVTEKRGRNNEDCSVLKRKIPNNFNFVHSSDLFHYAYAFKKLDGHSGDQNQINRLQNKDEFFDLCSHAYENDLLVLLKHSLNHYVGLLIPSEYAKDLQSLIGTNINFSVNNPLFDSKISSDNFCKLMEENVEKEFDDLDRALSTQNTLNGHDKEQIVKTRVGQGSFRKLLIEQRGCTCELCNINVPEVLRASHIRSWSSSNAAQRMDLQNGLLLCANHDALFDRHMISFNPETAELLISSSIDENQIIELKLNTTKTLSFSDRMKEYMTTHKSLFEK